MSGDKMFDDFRYSDSRGEFHTEAVAARAWATADIAAALRPCCPGELAYLTRLFGLLKAAEHKGVSGVGDALLVLIGAEEAKREWARAAELAMFDMLAAELQPEPLPTGDMTGIPKWSEISPSDDE